MLYVYLSACHSVSLPVYAALFRHFIRKHQGTLVLLSVALHRCINICHTHTHVTTQKNIYVCVGVVYQLQLV